MKTMWAKYADLAARRYAVSPDGDRMALTVGGFFQVMGKEAGRDAGWKMHVSVAAEDVPAAWDLLYPFLESEGIACVKVASPGTVRKLSASAGHPQRGKMITVYADARPRAWAELAARMEGMLRGAGIRPGPEVAGDSRMFGSRYLSFRNDHDAAGNYVDARKAQKNDYAPTPFCGRRS